MYFLFLLNEGIVLRNAAEGKFIHEIDLVRVVHVLVRKCLDSDGECRTEEHNLTVFRVELQKLFDDGCKFG